MKSDPILISFSNQASKKPRPEGIPETLGGMREALEAKHGKIKIKRMRAVEADGRVVEEESGAVRSTKSQLEIGL